MTSKLEKYLSNELYIRFGQYSIRQNYRPDWMEGLELDFYIDELKIAAEVQGQQHYNFVEYFHRTQGNFEAQKQRDEKKKIICKERNIMFFEVFTEKDADLFVQTIKDLLEPTKYLYREDKPRKTEKQGLGYRDILLIKKNVEKQKQDVLIALENRNKKDLLKFYMVLKTSARTIVKYPKYLNEKELAELDIIQKRCKAFFNEG